MKQVPITFLIDEALRTHFLKAAELDNRVADDIIVELLETYIEASFKRAVPASQDRISPAERVRRENAVRFSWASLGLEGVKPSAEEGEHARRFINGDIDLDEYVQVRSAAAREH